ncbi:MAG: heme exporter protein CcmD [Cellvibrionales bacterium]|nr:heme exporter protein CcmD [Cellvibrionales bacterium]
MKFDSMSALLFMDGHGIYVWTTFLVTFVIFGGLVVIPLLQKRSLLKKLKRSHSANRPQVRMQESV